MINGTGEKDYLTGRIGMTRRKLAEKIAAICLAAVCVVSMSILPAPAAAFAADNGSASQNSVSEQTLTLKAEAKGPTRIGLSWNAAKAPQDQQKVEYRVFKKDGTKVDVTDKTSYEAEALTPATKYSFYVEAWALTEEAAGESGSESGQAGGSEASGSDGQQAGGSDEAENSGSEGGSEAAEPTETMIAKSDVVSCTTKKQASAINGVTKSLAKKARKTLSVKITVSGTMGSPVLLQQYKNKKWVTKKTIETKNTAAAQSINVVYPNVWWKKNKTYWRYVVKAGTKNTQATYGMVTLKTKKYYQNPKRYVQIKNKISKHGHNYYTAPVLTNNMSTRKQHVEAMIKTAKKYLGDPYIDCRSQAPGKGVDCSGLVMQACYGAGVDLWPSNPWRHRFPKFEYESRRIAKMKTLKTVSWKNRRRGDLLFYSRGGRVMHVAIYLGHGKIIHSSYPNVRISRARSATWGRITRVARVFN